MATTVKTAKVSDKVSEITGFFDEISGLPIVSDDLKVVGVVSKKDLDKSSDPVRKLLYAPDRSLPTLLDCSLVSIVSWAPALSMVVYRGPSFALYSDCCMSLLRMFLCNATRHWRHAKLLAA